MNSFDPDPRPKRTSLGLGAIIRLVLLGGADDEDDDAAIMIMAGFLRNIYERGRVKREVET
jgi:hypothetical protein